MTDLKQRLADFRGFKETIGWTWANTADRLGWSNAEASRVQTLKLPILDEQLAYLEAVAAAVASIPPPEKGAAQPTGSPTVIQEVHVMMLDDIAIKLADEYRALADDASGDELRIGRAVISRLAARFNVAEQVRGLLTVKSNEIKPIVSEADMHKYDPQAPYAGAKAQITDASSFPEFAG